MRKLKTSCTARVTSGLAVNKFLTRDIGAAECGSKRRSEINCPEACPFNPFAPVNYDQFLDIERRALGSMARHGGLLSARAKGRQAWPGERNDEREVLRGLERAAVALIELRWIRDSLLFEGVDLLSPEPNPMVITDRSVAARATRFSTLLTWVYPVGRPPRTQGKS